LASYQQDAEIKDIMALTRCLRVKKYDIIGYSGEAIIDSRLVLGKMYKKGIRRNEA
jgi:hypothetical protein